MIGGAELNKSTYSLKDCKSGNLSNFHSKVFYPLEVFYTKPYIVVSSV